MMTRVFTQWAFVAALVAAFFLLAPSAYADDVAEEADLHFAIGAERYQARDYRNALQSFLLSNRLAPNRNVMFNIARTYEQLQQFSSAFRYYSTALDGEADPAVRKRIQGALTRLQDEVGVLDIVTDPPGATIYIDRRDLGAYGSTPRSLAFESGRHRVIVELPGHDPAESDLIEIEKGRQVQVRLVLPRILGTLRIDTTPAGAVVRLGRESAEPSCKTPCQLPVPPGRHLVHLQGDGYERAVVEAEVEARKTASIRSTLRPVSATLSVTADETDATVEVDGRPMGLTPAVLNVRAGRRRLRVTLKGFVPVEQVIELRENELTKIAVQLRPIESVSAVSRVEESVQDAPSSVSIITDASLRAMAFPSVYEALRGVRGVANRYDRVYASVGFRGLAPLGDEGNRVLILLDGHPINENWLGATAVGHDFLTDIEDVERIEVVRGPGSVVYGTNAVSGVINVITHGRDRPTSGSVSVSASEYGLARARGMAHLRVQDDSGGWVAVSGGHATGRDFHLPEYTAGSPSNDGMARNMDGFNAGTVIGGAWWGPVSASWYFHQREKTIPTAYGDTLFADPRLKINDRRGSVEARFEPRLSGSVDLLLRTYLDIYGYDAAYPYEEVDEGLATETYRGAWTGAEARLVMRPISGLRIMAGAEGQNHFRVEQKGQTSGGSYLDRNDTYMVGAGYLTADADPSPATHVSAGARLDAFSSFGTSLNPRVALILRPYDGGNLKLMGGKAFRAPSIYELFYNDVGDGSYLPTHVVSKDLRPEVIWSPEVEYSHRFSPTWIGLVSGFGNYVTDLIVLRGEETQANPSFYANSGSPILLLGGEVELRRDWRQGWMFSASYSFQRARYIQSDDPTAPELREVPNSPQHLGSVQGAIPILNNALTAATRLTVEGPRYDRYDEATDPAQGRTDWVAVWDLVLSGRVQRTGVRYAAGVYNAMDWRYSLPVGTDVIPRVVLENGRTFLLSAALDL